MNVRVNLNYPIYDGAEIVFKAPCDASEVTGLIVYYPSDAGEVSSVFTFADANANDLGNIDALFAAGAVVKVIIDTDTNMAFVQNAVTNAYLESRFAGIGGGGNVVIVTRDKMQASHTAGQIVELLKGGSQVLFYNDIYYSVPVFANPYMVEFIYLWPEYSTDIYYIDETGKVTWEQLEFASRTDLVDTVKSVNGQTPDENGNVQLSIPDAGNYTIKVNRGIDNETGETIYTTEDFDWDEFQAAVEAGKAVCCRVYDVAAKENDGFTATIDYPLVNFWQEERYATFRRITINIDEILEIWGDGSVIYERDDLDIYPAFVFAIDGKPCHAGAGWSWDFWIHSNYNYLGITSDEFGTVVDSAGDDVVLIDNPHQIRETDKIQIFGRYMVS